MTQTTYPSGPASPAPGLIGREVFTASGTFTKANYPGAQSVRVLVVGGGGGGGGIAAVSAAAGGGGGAGGYAESLIDIGSLSSSETVTVGSGGSGSNASNGSSGGSSSFGSHTVATGGSGGLAMGAANEAQRGMAGGTGTAGDITSAGGPGGNGTVGSVYAFGGAGGDSALGGGGIPTLTSGNGSNAPGPGGGGSGANNTSGSGSNRTGGAGANGIVIVEVYSNYIGDTSDFATRQYVDEGPRGVLASSTRDAVSGNIGTSEANLLDMSVEFTIPPGSSRQVLLKGSLQSESQSGPPNYTIWRIRDGAHPLTTGDEIQRRDAFHASTGKFNGAAIERLMTLAPGNYGFRVTMHADTGTVRVVASTSRPLQFMAIDMGAA